MHTATNEPHTARHRAGEDDRGAEETAPALTPRIRRGGTQARHAAARTRQSAGWAAVLRVPSTLGRLPLPKLAPPRLPIAVRLPVPSRAAIANRLSGLNRLSEVTRLPVWAGPRPTPALTSPAIAASRWLRQLLHAINRPVPLTEQRVAERFAEALAPTILISATTLLIALHSAPTAAAGIGWAALAVFFAVLIPDIRAWWGAWRDEHRDPTSVRGHRRRPVTFGLAPMVVGLALLVVFDSPREVLALMVAMFGALHTVAAIRRLWQWRPSAHAAVAGGCASALVAVFGSTLLTAYLVAAAAGWSRVTQGSRSGVEAITGTVIGILITAPAFLLIA